MDDTMDPAIDTTPIALRLPPEILKEICDELPNKDIKELRLTCRTWAQSVVPRTPRVIISANPLNIEVFNAIASHESFRRQVKEVIWDEGILYDDLAMSHILRFPPRRVREPVNKWFENPFGTPNEFNGDGTGKVPDWFREGCESDSMRNGARHGEDCTMQLSCRMPIAQAWSYYTELLKQQRQVMASKAHIRALEKHIGSFPALRRITITPATCGMLFNPLYETPMVRAFPSGYLGPLSRGWQNRDQQLGINRLEWEHRASRVKGSNWQGIRTIARVLSEGRDGGRVTEFHIDTRRLGAGLTMMRFNDKSHETLMHLEALLTRPGIKHLHLDLLVSGRRRHSILFRQTLKKAVAGKELEHLHIGTHNLIPNYHYIPNRDAYAHLGTLRFSRLRHFGLSHFFVDCSDLWQFLDALPETLRSVELSMIHLVNNGGHFRRFLQEMRDKSGWPARDTRPTLRIYLPYTLTAGHGGIRQVRLDDDVTKFLYEGGVNPFMGNLVLQGHGTVEDVFDPQFEENPLSVEHTEQED